MVLRGMQICAGSEGVHEVQQRERAGSYASDYLLTWAGLAQRPDDALAGFQSMLAAGRITVVSAVLSECVQRRIHWLFLCTRDIVLRESRS